jgi:hypothetical protein
VNKAGLLLDGGDAAQPASTNRAPDHRCPPRPWLRVKMLVRIVFQPLGLLLTDLTRFRPVDRTILFKATTSTYLRCIKALRQSANVFGTKRLCNSHLRQRMPLPLCPLAAAVLEVHYELR